MSGAAHQLAVVSIDSFFDVLVCTTTLYTAVIHGSRQTGTLTIDEVLKCTFDKKKTYGGLRCSVQARDLFLT